MRDDAARDIVMGFGATDGRGAVTVAVEDRHVVVTMGGRLVCRFAGEDLVAMVRSLPKRELSRALWLLTGRGL